jgi:hypothetical protein
MLNGRPCSNPVSFADLFVRQSALFHHLHRSGDQTAHFAMFGVIVRYTNENLCLLPI